MEDQNMAEQKVKPIVEQKAKPTVKKEKVVKPYVAPKGSTLVKANAFTGRKSGCMYFVGKDDGIYERKMIGTHKTKTK
jgi:hypothetical protein